MDLGNLGKLLRLLKTTSAAGPEGSVYPLKMSSFRSGRLNPGASSGKTGLPFDKLKSLAEKIDRCGHYIKSVLLFCFLFFIIYMSLLLQKATYTKHL